MVCGWLLARSGVDVVVLEKHEDFFRDFRGDTIHPATLQLLAELGAIDDFLALPHSKMERLTMETPSGSVTFADFTKLSPYGYIAFVPQWDFLDFVNERARRYPWFRLLRPAEATELVHGNDRVVGVRATTTTGTLEVRAHLVIAADGRNSTVRRAAGLDVVAESPPIDVLWFRLPRHEDERLPFFRKSSRNVVICIDRNTYWQIAYVIPHRGFDAVKAAGLPAFRNAVVGAVPALADRVPQIEDWEAVKLLSVRVDRLKRWFRPGLLCIGDAAHAMSPAGGVGINLAIQDAVAAANVLAPAFRSGVPTLRHLRAVQRRRALPVRLTQLLQVRILADLYPRSGEATAPPSAEDTTRYEREALAFRLLERFPALRYVVGRLVGRGIRPEHVGTAEAAPLGA